MQRVHTLSLRSRPCSLIVIRWMLRRNIRLVRRLEWLTLWPKLGPLPHTSHLPAKLSPFASPLRAE